MSWDIFVFNATRAISDIDDIEESLLVAVGTWQEFKQLLAVQFSEARFDDNWCVIDNGYSSLETSIGPLDETMSNTIFHLYGAQAIYPLIALCRQNNWQAFDTALGKMLNLDKPEENGYLNFTAYLKQIKQSN